MNTHLNLSFVTVIILSVIIVSVDFEGSQKSTKDINVREREQQTNDYLCK